QAASIGKSGETYILDMGEPVKIADLARDLIRLSGLEPDVDIRIEYTGIRPGEKLFEELMTDEEKQAATAHEMIFVASKQRIDSKRVERTVKDLQLAAEQEEHTRIRQLLGQWISGCAFAGTEEIPNPLDP